MAKLNGDIAKLPKWAQEYIRDLERERESAVHAMREIEGSLNVEDGQIRIGFFECTGEKAGPSEVTRAFGASNVQVEYAPGKWVSIYPYRVDRTGARVSVDTSATIMPTSSNSFQIVDIGFYYSVACSHERGTNERF